MNVVIVTMDPHVASATDRARCDARAANSGPFPAMFTPLRNSPRDPGRLERCRADIAEGHIIVNMMLFLEDHFQPLLPALAARRDHCDAMVCAMSAGEVTKLTRMGRFDMSAPSSGPMALLKKLRGDQGQVGDRRRQSDGDVASDARSCCASFRERRRTCAHIS